ncbi:metal ABC transporter ATP-binding protein [Hydrogenimonas urashimensis]|uniref:metal ABC transporter ATP-binding protein n=1 Tax=Hydrogenimonas urashimensis TaxID=2740515 RepID=UPI0019158F3D|nr:ABC transporter ATP-binding protein [Hydrogenimonas urashimensis]
MSDVAVDVRKVTFAYDGQPVVVDVSFRVEKGDFLAIIGPNGGGKSTLLKLMMGILKPQKGEILLFGKHPDEKNVVVGYVPQETGHNLDFPVTVLDVVLMGLLHKRNRLRRYDSTLIKKAEEALKKVRMSAFSDRRIAELSGGQRQRVLIARALCSDPDILMLDEPTASIDFSGQREIFELLEQLNRSMTVVVVSHDMSMVMGYAKHALYVSKSALMHTIDAHTRYQIKHQLQGHEGHYCGAEFWQDMGKKIECTKECKDA